MGKLEGWVALAAALALAACDDSEPADAGVDAASAASDAGPMDAACPAHDAAIFALPDAGPPDPGCEGARCGGDLAGAWEIVSACAVGMGDGTFLRCAEGRLTMRGFEVTATWTFGADGSVAVAGRELAIADAHLPLDCYGVPTCDRLEVVAAAAGLSAACVPSPPLDARCRSEACDCRFTLDEPALMLEATYAADAVAGTVTITLGSETIEGEFCVEADELWLHATRFGGVDYRYRMRRVTP